MTYQVDWVLKNKLLTCSWLYVISWQETQEGSHPQYSRNIFTRPNFIKTLWKWHGLASNVLYSNTSHQQHMFSLFQITIPWHKQLPPKQSSSLSQPQHPRTSISNTKTTELHLQHKVWKWKQRSQLPDHLWHSHAQTVDNLFHQWGILQYKIWPQNSSESHHLNTEMDENQIWGFIWRMLFVNCSWVCV